MRSSNAALMLFDFFCQFRGNLLGGSSIKGYSIFGSILGSPFFSSPGGCSCTVHLRPEFVGFSQSLGSFTGLLKCFMHPYGITGFSFTVVGFIKVAGYLRLLGGLGFRV